MIIQLKYFNDTLNTVLIFAPVRKFFCVKFPLILSKKHVPSGTVTIHFLDEL